VSDLKFAQPASRNLIAPVLVAFLVLGIAIALLVRFTPRSVADTAVIHAAAYPAHTVFKSDSILVNRDRSQDDLYAVVNVSIADRLNLPLFIKDFTGTLVTEEGEQIVGTAAYKNDLENMYITFPALRPLSSAPLVRETLVSPDSTVDGMVLLHFPVSAEIWNHRRSATLNVDLYHQGPLAIAIPQDLKVAVPEKDKTSTD
jgi:hypothetical protein